MSHESHQITFRLQMASFQLFSASLAYNTNIKDVGGAGNELHGRKQIHLVGNIKRIIDEHSVVASVLPRRSFII